MATVKVVDLISRAQTLLKDTSSVRWAAVELQNYLNDGYREIVNRRPDANAQVGTFTCVAGYRQSITTSFANAQRLLEVIANKSATSSKKIIRLVDRQTMDDQLPGWPAANESTNIEKYMFDHRLPKEFLTYPPARAGTTVEIVYSTFPAAHNLTEQQLTNPATATTINLDDTYANPLLDYMLYRAYSKDAEQSGNAARAVAHFQAMMDSLNGINTSEQKEVPEDR
jgi:hypothetical protein